MLKASGTNPKHILKAHWTLPCLGCSVCGYVCHPVFSAFQNGTAWCEGGHVHWAHDQTFQSTATLFIALANLTHRNQLPVRCICEEDHAKVQPRGLSKPGSAPHISSMPAKVQAYKDAKAKKEAEEAEKQRALANILPEATAEPAEKKEALEPEPSEDENECDIEESQTIEFPPSLCQAPPCKGQRQKQGLGQGPARQGLAEKEATVGGKFKKGKQKLSAPPKNAKGAAMAVEVATTNDELKVPSSSKSVVSGVSS